MCENPALVCNDNNACTDDSCNTGTGCVYAANNANACTDNSLCTGPDVCQNGACVGQNPAVCPPDANVCTTESCNPATGSCRSTSNTNACDDGNACTTGDSCGPTLTENFDGGVAPSLPPGWTSTVTGQGSAWTTVSTSSDTAPNSAFGFDGPGPAAADEVLVSPLVNITTPSAQLTFKNRWSFESAATCFDAGVLEIDINGGGFTDIVLAGGSFVSGGYTGTVATGFGNPLGGRSAWCTVSAGYPNYLTTIVTLPAAAAGRPIRLRWRIGTDTSTGAPGQNIDSIVLVDGSHVCKPGTGPVATPPEVQNVGAAADKVTYSWAATASATQYDVVRGNVNALPVGPGGGDEVCFGNLLGATVTDPAVPAPGAAFWYLTRAESSCGAGTYGHQGFRGAPGAARATTTCP